MSDNLRRYFAIQKALKSLRPTEPKGNVARHLNTLAMLIAGIIGSQKCHLPAVARKVPVRRQTPEPNTAPGTLCGQ